MNHPLAIGIILLLQTLNTCLISGTMYNSFWFSYILFIIIIGGILVLFIDMTSLASNEIFSPSNNTILAALITSPALTCIIQTNQSTKN